MSKAQQKQSSGLVLVLGGTGNTGRRVTAGLSQMGISFRGVSRTSSPSFDWNKPEGWPAVLDHVKSVYLAYPQELPIQHATKQISAFIDQAQKAGVRHIVLLTGRGEAEGLAQENLLKQSGLHWTVIRSAWFSQNFTEGHFNEWRETGRLTLPEGRASEPFVDIEDLAQVACAALTQAGHNKKIYEVTGPRLISFEEVAADLTQILQKPLTYNPVTHTEYRDQLKAYGVPEDGLDLVDFLFQELLDGRNAYLGDGIQKALGREPTDFKAVMKRDLS